MLVIYLLAATQDLSLQATRFHHLSLNSLTNVNFQNTGLTAKCGEALLKSMKNERKYKIKYLNNLAPLLCEVKRML